MTEAGPGLEKLSGTLVLAGAGRMGSAMLQGWVALGLDAARVSVIDPQPQPAAAALTARGLRLNPAAETAVPASVLVLAVKPQTAPVAAAALARFVDAGTLIVSIMAGRTLRFLQEAFPGAACVRSMPNTPAALGQGITVAVPGPGVSAAQRALAHQLLAAVGAVEWVEDETLLDAVTAVSGSGPAYVFLLAECLAQAGVEAGLPAPLAARLARETLVGAAELLRRSPLDPRQLRGEVTSPGGTTAAALEVLNGSDGLAPLMRKAVAAAARRSRELAG